MHGSYTSFILSPLKPLLFIRHFFICLFRACVILCHILTVVAVKVKSLNYICSFLLWAGANCADQGQPNVSRFCLNTFLEVAEPAQGGREEGRDRDHFPLI